MPTNPPPLILLPGHRITITVDADKATMGVTITAFRGEEWLGESSVSVYPDAEQLQGIVDILVKRRPMQLEK